MALPSISPTQDTVLASLRGFLTSVLPAGIEIVQGMENRVAGPVGPDYVIMTPTLMTRLETNVDLYADTAFTASISTNGTLSVTAMLHGSIQLGNTLFGVGVPGGISIASAVTGTGGVGDYALSGTIGSVGLGTMASGVLFAMAPQEWVIQCDVYGPNSADYSQIISTLFRDDFGIEAFGTQQPPPGWSDIPPGGTISAEYVGVAPLYADDPRQQTQVLGEMQFELRWTVDAHMQVNSIVVAPQAFSSTIKISPFPVDLFLP